MKNKYFIKRNGDYYLDRTKEEIYSLIDNNDPNTFIPYLEIMDYPYIKREWDNQVKNGIKYGYSYVFGRYLALMRLKGFRSFSYKDSDWLNKVREEKIEFDINE